MKTDVPIDEPLDHTSPVLIPVGNESADDAEVEARWHRLATANQSSSQAAYLAAVDAREIIARTRMTVAAFAAEARRRKIPGFGSQGSISRRLRWAGFHEDLWDAGILPRGAFIPEAATRPLFDSELKLSRARRIELIAELLDPYLTDEQKAEAAAALNEARMREHLGRDPGPTTRRTSQLRPTATVRRLLAEGMTADAICELAHALEDSATESVGGDLE